MAGNHEQDNRLRELDSNQAARKQELDQPSNLVVDKRVIEQGSNPAVDKRVIERVSNQVADKLGIGQGKVKLEIARHALRKVI